MKKVLLVISLILGILIPEMVSAATFNVSDTTTDYIIREKDGIVDNIQVKRIVRGDNRFVYLLEVGDISGNNIVSSDTYGKVSEEVLDKIKLIAYYGYMYKNHTDSKWYSITQFLIWKEIDKKSNYYFDNLEYKSDINELEKLVSEHYLLPSFANQKILADSSFFVDTIDTNKVLSNYDIVDKNGYSMAINNNILSLYAKLKKNSYAKFVRRSNQYTNKPLFYIDDNGSDIILPGNLDDIYFSVVYHIMKANVKVTLMDKSTNKKISNATFTLLDTKGNAIKTAKTDENGEIVFSDLLYGNYQLRQEDTSSGYLYSSDIRNLGIHTESTELVIYNEQANGKVRIYTTDTLGVEFGIYNSNKKCVSSFTTNGSKYYEFELPYGIYYIAHKNSNIYETSYYEVEIDSKEKSVDIKSGVLSEIITVPDTYINEVNYNLYIYTFLIISGLFICGVRYEKE